MNAISHAQARHALAAWVRKVDREGRLNAAIDAACSQDDGMIET
jgi:hypothetical protein